MFFSITLFFSVLTYLQFVYLTLISWYLLVLDKSTLIQLLKFRCYYQIATAHGWNL